MTVPSTGEWPFPTAPVREPRVVSTSPSGTEICYALGVEPVGVSHACDVPAAVSDTPAVDRSRVTGEASADRHAPVDVARTTGVYEVDAALLSELAPDLVVSQSVCGVCAADEPRVTAALDEDVAVLGLSARTLESGGLLSEPSDRPGWESIPAVASDRVHVFDGGPLNRWTPRLATVAADLAGLFATG